MTVDQRAGFPRDMFAANVTQAAMEWDGRRNIDLYHLIADALGVTLIQMLEEIAREIEFIEAKGMRDGYLFGHSYGGWIAGILAQNLKRTGDVRLHNKSRETTFIRDVERI